MTQIFISSPEFSRAVKLSGNKHLLGNYIGIFYKCIQFIKPKMKHVMSNPSGQYTIQPKDKVRNVGLQILDCTSTDLYLNLTHFNGFLKNEISWNINVKLYSGNVVKNTFCVSHVHRILHIERERRGNSVETSMKLLTVYNILANSTQYVQSLVLWRPGSTNE